MLETFKLVNNPLPVIFTGQVAIACKTLKKFHLCSMRGGKYRIGYAQDALQK